MLLAMEMFSSLSNNKNLVTHQSHRQEIIEIIDLVNGNQDKNNRRKRRSKVWEEMTKYKGADGEELAKCVHCEKVFHGSSKKGTTHLKNHLERCRKKRKACEDAQKSIKTSHLTSSDVIEEKSVVDRIKNCFDEDGRPNEYWNPQVLNSRKVDILKVYQEEKEKVRRFLSKLSCRFSLTIEWLLDWSILTVHYIDDNWEPNRKIISCYQSLDIDFKNWAAICLDLQMDKNICSIVCKYVYNIEKNDAIEEINSWFSQRGSLPFGGILFSNENNLWCFSFMDGIFWLWNRYSGIRECVRYVYKTPSNQRMFEIAVDNVKTLGKKVSTSERLPSYTNDFQDFEMALDYREAFCELELIDPDFKSMSINLTNEQWDEAIVAYEYWKEFRSSASTLYIDNYPTPNMYFSKFCGLYMKLLSLETSEGYHLGKNTSPLQTEILASIRQKFIDIYWNKYNLILAIAVILDPRFKMEIVQLWYNRIYGCDADHHLEKIIHDFNHVYNKYAKSMETSSISYLDAMGKPCSSSHNLNSPKSELDRYLNEPKFPSVEKFNILAWWHLYSPIFPTLARMARDFLAIPISFDISNCWDRRVEYINDDEELDDDLKPALAYLSVL